jgi:hypothetical protein
MTVSTYLQAAARCAAALGGGEPAFPYDDFMRHLALAAETCAATPVTAPPPFDSGVAPGRVPLELSVTLGAAGPGALRFLVQPEPNTLAGNRALRPRVAALARALGCEDTLPLLLAIMDALLDDETPPRGNFSAWLGLQQTPTAPASLKAYFNPWAHRQWSPGEWLVRAGSFIPGLDEALVAWSEMMPHLPPAAPMILGLDADARGLQGVKVYLTTRMLGPHDLDGLLAGWGTPAQQRVWPWVQAEPCWARDAAGQSVEVHFAMRARGEGDVSLKLNLFCPHVFADDADALRAVRLWAQQGYELPGDLDWFAAALDGTRLAPGARLNFVGLGEDKLDVYFRPW